MKKQFLIKDILKVSILPLLILLLFLAGYSTYVIKIEHILKPEIKKYLGNVIFTLFTFVIAFWFQRLTGIAITWYARRVAPRTKTCWDEEFIPLVRKGAKITIWIIIFIIVLARWGINISALIATLGVSSLAVALAAQDTIANIIAGFLIMIDRPFRIGDEIKLPSGEKVKVLDIGIRRSKFLNIEDNAIIIVPNLDLSKSKILNYTYGKENKVS